MQRIAREKMGEWIAAKLRVSLADDIFKAEGEDAFVKEMHLEFREYVGQFFGAKPPTPVRLRPDQTMPEGAVNESDEDQEAPKDAGRPNKARRAPTRRRRISNPLEGAPAKKVKYEPQVDVDLKLPGLVVAFSAYDFKGHHEMVLFFGHFFSHDAGLSPFTANHVFMCYRLVKLKTPKAFAQSLYDNRSKRHFFKIESLESIAMTHIDNTYFDRDLKKKD